MIDQVTATHGWSKPLELSNVVSGKRLKRALEKTSALVESLVAVAAERKLQGQRVPLAFG